MPKPRHKRDSAPAPDVKFRSLWELLRPSFKKYRLRILLGFCALVGVDLLQLLIPLIVKHGVDGLTQGTIEQDSLFKLGALIILIAITVATLRFSWRYLIIGFSRILEKTVRTNLINHILKLDAPFFEKHTTGDLMARSSNDMSSVQMACGMGMVAATDALLMSSAAICFMLYIHPTLTVLAILPMPFLAIATKKLSGVLHIRFNKVQEEFSSLTEFARSTLISIRLIKANTMEDSQTTRFNKLGQNYVKSNLKVATIQGLMSPVASLIGSLGMLMVLYYGGRLVIREEITIGDFVAFISYLYMLVWPMMAIGWVANLVQRGITSLRRIHGIISSKPVLPAIEDDPHQQEPKVGFALRSLNFSYPSSSEPSLTDINLELGPGFHGITGRTGSGKTTLCRLLTRTYPVEPGQLYFNHRDVNQLSVDYIRRHIGYVSQEPVLFSESIRDNIRLGKPDADQAAIEHVAKVSALHEDICSFPDGYDTIIGERGVKLSGGQRQRIALARALLLDPPALIIDDGLSAVDVTTENEILEQLLEIFKDKTVIVVSNRVKLLSRAERIIVMEEGVVHHDLPHKLLLEKDRLYRVMYDKQMHQGIPEGST